MKKMTYHQSEIHFGDLQELGFNEILAIQFAQSKKIILTDETVGDHWLAHLVTNFPELAKAEIIQIPAGEEFKNIDVCKQIWEALSEYEISRNDLIINLGGGVITDLGGFVASLFKRGLQFINIPTTLLSQVDASVGGKTGVDLGPYKNQIGVFADACHVFIDPQFLSTLPNEQKISGFAEMLKHGLIADAAYWAELKDLDILKSQNILNQVYHSVELKKKVVEADPTEKGQRKILNFGHTIGHGIEGHLLQSEKPTFHGYGVAWGMQAEAFISCKKELITELAYLEIKKVIQKYFPKCGITDKDFKAVIKLMYNDKKNTSEGIQFTLLAGIGKAIYNQEVSDAQILASLREICN